MPARNSPEGENSAEPAAKEGGPWASTTISVLGTYAFSTFTELFQSFPSPFRQILPLVIGTVVAVVVHELRKRISLVPPWPRIWTRISSFLIIVAWGAAGAGLVGLVWSVREVFVDKPCRAATELRLVTAPENVLKLRERAEEYTRLNVGDGCAAVRLTVAPAPSVTDLIYGLDTGWERNDNREEYEPYVRLHGLQPDAWVATSTGEADYVRSQALRKDLLAPGGASVGREQLVLALLQPSAEALTRRLSDPEEHPLRQVWQTVGELGMSIARPFPETSSAALIGTSDLFAAFTSAAERKEVEQAMISGPLRTDTVPSLLCAFYGSPARERVALLVPGHSVDDYNDGRVTEEDDAVGCPTGGQHGRAKLAGFRPAGASVLDYPFVKVNWPGQTTAERRAIVDDFEKWLAGRPLYGDTTRDGVAPVHAEQLSRTLGDLQDTLRPARDLHLVLDQSGSALGPVGTRVAEGLRGLSGVLGPRDGVRVSGLASRREHGSAELRPIADRRGRDQLDVLARKIEAAGFSGWDAPVSAALGAIPGDLAQGVIVLTDGRLFDDEGDDPAAALGAALEREPLVSGLQVLVLGQRPCAVTRLKGTAKPYSCLTAGDDLGEDLAKMIISSRGR